MNWRLIESSAELTAVLAEHREHPHVAVDTEFRRRDTFYPQVALLQLCWGGDAFLIDPLSLDDLTALKTWLTDPAQVKFLHSASEDLEVFAHWLGVLPTPLFDTQRAATLVGLGGGQSYRALVASFHDIDLPKDETQSDWLQRPLTDRQAEYAALDVTYLYPIGLELEARATELGRLDWVLEEGARLRPGGKPPISKFRSAYKLSPRQQWALTELVDWREAEAKGRDRPRSWILSDKVVMATARALPSSVRELSAIDEMPAGLVRRAGDTLLARIAAANDRDMATLPAEIATPLSGSERQLLKQLTARVLTVSESLAVPPEALMPKADLEQLIRLQANPSLPLPAAWSGWRAERVVAPLREWLSQERSKGSAEESDGANNMESDVESDA